METFFVGFLEPVPIYFLKMTTSDSELLQQFARNRSDDAFKTLVARHIDLVYSAALRQVRSAELAEEITQTVFIDLSKNAHKLKPNTLLTAWLYQVTRRTAIDAVRSESRRQQRELAAMELADMTTPDSDWKDIKPLLDEAMNALEESDRNSLLLRYFENKSLREVGQALGTSDDAAQKRVSRAVERLRDFFSEHGVAVGATTIVASVSANAVQAAPVPLALTITKAAAATTMTTLAATAPITMNWLTAKTISAIITSALVAATGTYVVLQAQTKQLKEENLKLLAKQNELAKQHDDVATTVSTMKKELDRAKKDNVELLRLRGEVGLLRRQSAETEKLRVENQQLRVTQANQSAALRTTIASDEIEKRNRCIKNLKQIDGATQQCALEHRLSPTNSLTAEDIILYFRDQKIPICPSGGAYSFGVITNNPTCSFPGHGIPEQ